MDTQQTTRIRPYTSRTQKAYAEGWELCAKMKRLSMKGKGSDIIEDVRRHFKRAQLYEFSKLAAEFATYLQYYYYHLKGDKKRGKKYGQLAIQYSELSHLENIALNRFAELSFQLSQTRNPSPQLIAELKATCNEFKAYLKYDSAQLWISTYSLLNLLADANKNQLLIIEQSYEVIGYLEKKGIERTAHFYKDMTPALIQEGRYEEASTAIQKAIQGINKGSLSWSIFIYYRLVIAFHQGQYQQAYELFLHAEKKRHINKAMAETWRIVKGYIKFLIEAGTIEGSAHFKIGKFLNEMEIFSLDKSGQNINIIILKIILRLRSDRDRILDEREAIQRYTERWLEPNSRQRIFLNMLHQISLGDFQKDRVKARGKTMLQQLTTKKGYDPDLEIIPYEYLWKMVLQNLD